MLETYFTSNEYQKTAGVPRVPAPNLSPLLQFAAVGKCRNAATASTFVSEFFLHRLLRHWIEEEQLHRARLGGITVHRVGGRFIAYQIRGR